MLSVLELQESELPSQFLALLPTHCDICGSENEITETLTMLRCSNKSCGEKSVQRLVTMLKDLGIKNMGESKCRSFLNYFELTNPYDIFRYEPSDGPLYEGCSMDFSEAMYEQINTKRKMLLWEYIRIGNMPRIRDSARKLFSGYDSLEEFFDDLDSGGISFVQDLLSIKGKQRDLSDSSSSPDGDDDEDNMVSVTAVEVYQTLNFFREDLFSALDYVEIKSLDTAMLNICISTSVGEPFSSKTDFVSSMNDQFEDKIHLNFLQSLTNDCDFLIWSKRGSATTKVKNVAKINAKRIAQWNTKVLNGESDATEILSEDSEYTLEECLEYGLIPILTGLEFQEYLETL